MATCAECVHVDVCRYYINSYAEKAGVDIPNDLFESCMNGDVCEQFLARDRFVELPCHVGETVYLLTEQTQKLGRKKITKAVIVECCVDNFRIGDAGYPSAALCDNENVWYWGVEPKMFGEIIFLSRETAEQALKEREVDEGKGAGVSVGSGEACDRGRAAE